MSELVIPFGEKVSVRSVFSMTREMDLALVVFLDRHLQRRTIVLVEHAWCDMDATVWVDAEEVSVVCRVVQGRETNPVADLRSSALVAVGNDVRGLKQIWNRQTRDRAPSPIGAEHEFPELGLVKTHLRLDCAVTAVYGVGNAHVNRSNNLLGAAHGDGAAKH